MASLKTGDEKTAQRSTNDVVQHLARHRIKAQSKVIVRREGSSDFPIAPGRERRRNRPARYVTGGYGHSRLGEWVFGGLTQELLAASLVCCLMSHDGRPAEGQSSRHLNRDRP